MVSWAGCSTLSSVLGALDTTFTYFKHDTGNTILPVIIKLGFLSNDALKDPLVEGMGERQVDHSSFEI